MGVERERFTKEEASRHRHSPALAECLVHLLSYDLRPLYDFGCGDGYYLQQISLASRSLKTHMVGVDASIEIPDKKWPYVIHPVDAASQITLGPPGDVICLEVAEHIASHRLPGLVTNLFNHVSSRGWLIMSWAVRGQAGTRHVSCRDAEEVLDMIIPMKFDLNEDMTNRWRETAGEDLWWFKKSLYIFQKRC